MDIDKYFFSIYNVSTYLLILMNKHSLLADERVASIREVQKNPSAVLRGITRVTRGSKTIGFFLSNEEFAELVESQEALSSKRFVKSISKARRDLATQKGTSLSVLAKGYGL